MQMQLIQGRLVIAGLFSSCLIEMETLEQVLRLSQGVRVWGLRGWLLTPFNLEEQRTLYSAYPSPEYFKFDHAFGPDSPIDVNEKSVSYLVVAFLDGFSGTVLDNGPESSG